MSKLTGQSPPIDTSRPLATFALSIASLSMAALLQQADAALIAYYQFDDAPAGTTATTLVDSSGNGLNGIAENSGGGSVSPVHSSPVPGPAIRSGLTGPYLNVYNTTSLRFTNTGGLNSNVGSRVRVNDLGGALMKPQDFTIEGFLLIDGTVNFPTLVGKSRADAGGASWIADTGPNQLLRVRSDHQILGTGGSTAGFNQGFSSSGPSLADGQWHHFAVTFRAGDPSGVGDATAGRFTLFIDYQQVGTGLLNDGNDPDSLLDSFLVYDNSPLYIGSLSGGRAFDGWIDEIRWTASVLTPDQFLYAIPEPSRPLLLSCFLLPLLARRRRRS